MMGHLLSAARARREKSISNDLDAKIEITGPLVIRSSYDKFEGTVKLINKSSPKRIIEVLAVKIWLEGVAVTRFQSKIDGQMVNQFQHTRFMPDESDLSNVSCDIIKIGDSKEKKKLRFGTHTFPFAIQLNGEVLPSTMQTQYGRIQYRLVLYISIIWGTLLNFAETLKMTTNGSFNLALDPILKKPMMITRKNSKSIFSSRPILKANLCLNQGGFLSGESVAFQFDVENTNCENVTRLSVSLVQKIIYFANKSSKNTMATLGHQELSCDTKDGQIHWESSIVVPGNLMPSFTKEKKSIEILYVLQFTVDINGKTGLKGETMILIGTVRDDGIKLPGGINTKGNPGVAAKAAAAAAAAAAASSSSRKYNNDDNSDTISLASFASSLPPGYSNLSSRRSSLETLPPPYDEIFGFEDWND